MYDAIIWGSVGAAGIGLAWLADAWAARTGRSRLLALLGLLPVLLYAVIVLAVWGGLDADTAYVVVSEVRRTERVAFRLASACGGMAAAVVLMIQARWIWTARGSWAGFDPVGTLAGAGLGALSTGAAVAVWWRLASSAVPDGLLLLSVGVLLAGTVPGMVRHRQDASSTADLRVRLLACAALGGALLAVRFAGHTTELAQLPWWSVNRPMLLPVATAALWEGLAWGLVPACVALGALVPVASELRPRHLAPLGAAVLGAVVMAGPLVTSVAMQASHEPLLDFAPLAADQAVPTVPDWVSSSPHHGCYWRWTASGGELVASPPGFTPSPCAPDQDPVLADGIVAPGTATLSELPTPRTLDGSTAPLTLLVQTPSAARYRYRVAPLEHDPAGTPMAGRSLQEIVDQCFVEERACDLRPAP